MPSCEFYNELILSFHSNFRNLFQWAEKADPSIGWNGITKATPLKEYPPEEPNRTDPVEVISKLRDNDEASYSFCSVLCIKIIQ